MTPFAFPNNAAEFSFLLLSQSKFYAILIMLKFSHFLIYIKWESSEF